MENQYRVALELGYPALQVRRVLQQQTFSCAGDLVDQLYELQLKSDEAEPQSNSDGIQTTEDKATKVTTALKTETAALLYTKTCLHCLENDRNIVTLPCSHLTLCITCASSVSKCPRPDCKKIIERKIIIYMA